MKEAGTLNWASPNIGGNNESGFAGLPGGYRNSDGTFYDVGSRGSWWSATEINVASLAWLRSLLYFLGSLNRGNVNKALGLSVRCLRN